MNEDITSNRHGGNPESREAFANLAPHIAAQEALIAEIIRRHSPAGLIAEEAGNLVHIPINCASARCSELKERGILLRKKIGETPQGKPVYERRRTRRGSRAAVLIWNPLFPRE